LFLWNIYTEGLAEGFRDKIFNPEIIATLGHALSNESSYIRSGAVKIFTAAVAQGAPHCFYRIFIPKDWQRGFGTRYLILKWLPNLDMHYAMNPPMSEVVQSKFSLLL
jgi:hypothetical protein